MKKKVIISIISAILVVSIMGCNGKNHTNPEKSNKKVVEEDTENVEETGETEEIEETEEENSFEKLFERSQELAGYTIITPNVQIILTSEGKVLAKGENTYGQIGNGERTYTETWSEVEGLENIVTICGLGNVGVDRYDKDGYGHCYALTSSGELYRWGGNILTPEKMTFFSKIEEMRLLNSRELFVKCETGEKYIVVARFNTHEDDRVFSVDLLNDDTKLYGYGFGDAYLMYDGKQLQYINAERLYQYGKSSFDEVARLEDNIKEIVPINITEKIANIIPGGYEDGCGGATIITDSGSVIGFTYREGSVNIEDFGGSNIKKASRCRTAFSLFNSGELTACGDNDSGQLGDGTITDYYDGFIDIDEAFFSDFEYFDSDEYCIALDEEYNVWGWGKGIGVSPEIIVENTEFINE